MDEFVDDFSQLGAMIAVCISWSVNKSVLWAVLHGSLSWFYVIYFLWK